MTSIYIITNLLNNKQYIGLTKRGLNLRFNEHKRSSINGHKTHLYNAMRKWGVDNFSIALLEETDDGPTQEKFYIKTLKPDYNMTEGGDGVVMRSKRMCITNGLKEWYVEINSIIPEGCWRGRTPANILSAGQSQVGSKRSQEAKDKTAAKHRGMKRSIEAKAKMSASAINHRGRQVVS